jgi:hypothetical protein
MTDHEKIAERAYFKWLAAGQPQDDGKVYWFAAEQELTRSIVEVEEVTEVEVTNAI